jgi:septum formation protein
VVFRASSVITPMTRVILASASPARLQLLRNAGLAPEVQVSHVDEEDIQSKNPDLLPADLAQLLAQLKCEEVVRRRTLPADVDGAEMATCELVIGCDSVFELDGRAFGKPETAEIARERWKSMMNSTGTLHTGHYLVYTDDTGHQTAAAATASTEVTIGNLTDTEIEAYLASGEPLHVAGGFTLDALGGAFVEGVQGDPSNVIGLSLPTTRHLVTQLGLTWTDLWHHRFANS